MMMLYFYHTLFIIASLGLALIRPSASEVLFFPWLILVIILNLWWWKWKQSVINIVVWLLFSPICIFLSLFAGSAPVVTSDDSLFQVKVITTIFVVTWCITGIYGNKKMVKPAMGLIDAMTKSVLLYYSNKYLLEHASEVNLSNQEAAFVNLLVLPLVLAIIWGKLFLDLRKELRSGVRNLPMTIYKGIFSDDFRGVISAIRKALSGNFMKDNNEKH